MKKKKKAKNCRQASAFLFLKYKACISYFALHSLNRFLSDFGKLRKHPRSNNGSIANSVL